MPCFIFGTDFSDIANTLFNKRIFDDVTETYRSPKYKEASERVSFLTREIRAILPDEHKNRLEELETAEKETDLIWEEYHYKQGFFDGLAAMQTLMFLLSGKPVNNAVSRLLDGFYRAHCNEGKSMDEVQELHAVIRKILAEEESLIAATNELCRQGYAARQEPA